METWTIIKFVIWIILLIFVCGTLYFTWMLSNIAWLIWSINTKFIANTPVEMKGLFAFLIIVMIIVFWRSWND